MSIPLSSWRPSSLGAPRRKQQSVRRPPGVPPLSSVLTGFVSCRLRGVSYDIHLLRFVNGEPEPQPAGQVHELLSSATSAPPDEHGYARVTWRGGEADVYGMTRAPTDDIASLMFSRPAEDDAIFDLIFQVAAAGEMAVLLQEGEVCLVSARQAEHLPPDVAEWPRHLVDSGHALAAVLRSL